MAQIATVSADHLSTVASLSDEPEYPVRLLDKLDRDTDSEDMSEVIFASALRNYMLSKGGEQKRRRNELTSSITRSRRSRERVRQVLDMIAENPSEDRMLAAVDLLSKAGPAIKARADEMAFVDVVQVPDDVFYVVGLAAAKADSSIISTVLLLSAHEPLREGAVEALGSLPPTVAKPLLRRTAETDSSEYLRRRASELLADLG